MGYIYKATNLINQKVYIGQTQKQITERQKEHIRESYYSFNNSNKRALTFFHFAILEYGEENFSFEEIEECLDEKLDEKERYWISFYNSDNFKIGYNMTKGGQVKPFKEKKLEKILQYDEEGNLLKIYENIKIAAKENNVAESSIRAVYYKEGCTCGGYQWRKENSEIKVGKTKHFIKKEQDALKEKRKQKRLKEKEEKENKKMKRQKIMEENINNQKEEKKNKIRVEQYNENWELVATYEKVGDAANILGVHISSLSHVFNKNQLFKGYYWIRKK